MRTPYELHRRSLRADPAGGRMERKQEDKP
jgi:hypothetical protein